MPQRKKKSLTLGDISGRLANIRANQLLYALLLVAVFLLGYLIARVQYLEKGTTASNLGTQPEQTAPVALKPEDAVRKIAEAKRDRLPVKGESGAKVTFVEFSDFECPFCSKFFTDALGKLTEEYVDTGKIKLEYRHFPLSFHPQAKPLALVSECANDQGKFWEMHDKIFTINSEGGLAGATADTYKQWAADLGLNTTEFNSCYDSGKHNELIDADSTLGSEIGVSGTPTFYINGQQMVGALPYQSFKDAIDCTLEGGKFTVDGSAAVKCNK